MDKIFLKYCHSKTSFILDKANTFSNYFDCMRSGDKYSVDDLKFEMDSFHQI
jgi:hypothetical protein